MYSANGTSLRGDINVKVEEASLADTKFIADRVLPVFSVPLKTGQYPKIQIAAGELLSLGSVDRAPDGSYGEVKRSWTYDTYTTQDRGLEERVDDVDQKDMSRYFNMEVAAAKLVLRNMKLAAEARAAAAIMNASTFTDATAAKVNWTYTLLTTLDFPSDVYAAVDRVKGKGEDANTIVMSQACWMNVRRATKTLNHVVGSVGAGAMVTPSTVATSFAELGITQVLIGRSTYNSAKKGQTASIANVWGDTYCWVGYVESGANSLAGSGAGFQLVWNEEGGQYVTETYRDEGRRSNIVRVRQHSIEKIVNANAGTLITTSYSAS
jgi:hypothetical protein